jgi:hypothetical protein
MTTVRAMAVRSMARRRLSLLVVGLLVLVVAAGGAWRSASAQSSKGFGSYSLVATAPGFEMTEDEPSANAHPEGGGTVPYSTVVLSNGPLGYALSSVAWPGATEANAGGIVGLLFPNNVGGTPLPDAITAAVGDNSNLANYPVRAEARSGSKVDDKYDTFPGATLTAHADAKLATAQGSMKKAEQPGSASFGSADSLSNAVLSDGAGQATATSKVSNINVGNVIKIDSVTSTADGSTDGVTAATTGSTTVQGMTIADQPAYVDEQGVHVGTQGQPANAIASQIANQALKDAGFQFFVTQAQTEQSGAQGSYTAGSLFIVWTPPSNPSGNVFVIALGGARVSVSASPSFGGPVAVTVPTVVTTPSVVPSGPRVTVPSRPAVTSPPAANVPATPAAAAPKATIAAKKPSAAFGGIPVPWVVMGALGAGLMAAGTRRLADDVIDRAPSTCPLETE